MCAVDFTIRQFLLPLAQALRDNNCKVEFACTPGSYTSEIEALGFPVLANPVARSMNVLSHAASIWRTYHLLKRGHFDIVHVHTPIAALVGRIAARLAGVKLRIYTAHGFYFHDDMPRMKRSLYVALEKLGAKCGNFIMTVSKEDEAAALRLGLATTDTVETIYNGIDLQRFDPQRMSPESREKLRAGLGIPPTAPVVGIVGRLVREKGFFELLDAAATILPRHPDTRFLVVGDVLPSDYDASKAEVLRHIRTLGIQDQIVFAGMVPDTAPWLHAMDFFCLPSYREGMPVSLLEAMAMALPAVATNIRGCREEVVDGQTGYLVPVRDARALAEKLLTLIENPAEARLMGIRGRERVKQHFDIRSVVAHQTEIYRRLILQHLQGARLPSV
jgi:glycosyltransferase involved in cell wall biosynthesis